MMRGLTTAQKGFLVALIPCALQVMTLTGLAAALFQEQHMAQVEAECRNSILETQTLEKQISDLIFVAVLYGEARGLLGDKVVDTALARAEQASATAGDPQLRKSADELIAVCEPLFNVGVMTSDAKIRDMERVLPGACFKLISDGEAFIQRQSAATADASLRHQQSRVITRAALSIAVVCSIGAALLLSRLFVGELLFKIKHLWSNSKSLSQRRPLEPNLSGTDEFAQFDNLLHRLDGELSEAMILEKRSFEESPQLVALLDTKLRFLQTNATAEKILGGRAERLDDEAHTLFQSAMEPGRINSFEYALRKNDGSEVGLLWSTYCSHDGQRLYCVAHDITAAMRAEADKRRYVSVLHQRLAMPIGRVEQLLERLLKSADGLTADAKLDLLHAKTDVRRLKALVRSMADLDTAGSVTPVVEVTACRFADLAARATSSIGTLAEAKQIKLTVQASDVIVIADEYAILRVLVNLLSNAIKFSPNSSEILLGCEPHDNGTVCISVQDQGAGVPEEFREKIFAPFAQAPNQPSTGQGVGLGLAICANIVRAHGGQIEVDVAKQGGSRFWFTLQRASSVSS